MNKPWTAWAENGRGSEVALAAGLAALTLITRVPLHAKLLYDQDAVQFALGLKHFDIRMHQPHPPGYPIFMVLARMVNAYTGDANMALVSLAIAFSVLSTLLIYWLARKLYGNSMVALLAALLLISSPLAWFYGEIASIYPASAFAAMLVALASWNLLKTPGWKSATVSGLTLAFAGGLRPDQMLLMLPLWLVPFVRERDARKYLAPAVVVLLAGHLSWYLPLVRTVGGMAQYTAIVREQFNYNAGTTSVLFGARVSSGAILLAKLLFALVMGAGAPATTCVIAKFLGQSAERSARLPEDPDRRLFLLAWVAPSLLFFGLVHFGQFGYLMVCLPALLLACASYLRERTLHAEVVFKGLACLAVAGSAAVFLFAPSPISAGATRGLQYLPVRREIAYRDRVAAAYFAAIAERPGENVIFVLPGAGTAYLDWRRLYYHFPERQVMGIRGWKGAGGLSIDSPSGKTINPRSDPALGPKSVTIDEAAGRRTIVVLPVEGNLVSFKTENNNNCSDITPKLEESWRVFRLLACEAKRGGMSLTLGDRNIAVQGK